MRYHANGVIDSTFGNNGIVLKDLSGSDNVVFQSYDIVTDFYRRSDGKLLISAYSYVANFNDSESFLLQYDEHGVLDKTFGNEGILKIGLSNDFSIQRLTNQSDGKLIAAVYKRIENESKPMLIRYLPDLNVGTIDFATKLNNALVYPNPLQEETILEYTLENPETLTIQLTDLNGRVLKTYLQNQPQKAGDYQQAIDLPNNLPKGFYLLRLASGNGQFAIKVIK